MAGPFVTDAGDVISSALSVGAAPKASKDAFNNFRIEQGQVTAVYAVDDPNNRKDPGQPGFNIVYDVRIVRANGAIEDIPRCRMLQPGFGGGINNFFEVVQTDPGSDADNPTMDKALKRGHQVLVAFIGGIKQAPIILGALPHTSPVAKANRPTQSDGVVAVGEIQGLNFKIDNDGGLTITFNGPRSDDGSLVNENGPTTIQIDSSGSLKISTNAQQSVEIDREAGTVTVTNGDTYIKSDANADKIQVVAGTVEIGTDTLQPQVVGDDWKSMMGQLIDAISQITVPTGVGPSGVPINAADFTQIKSNLDECLSTKHKVEK